MIGNYSNLIKTLILIIALAFISCNENDSTQTIEIIVQDFMTKVDENPNNNKLLGTISATSSQGILSFELTSESPTGALILDSLTGELFVKDSILFDFEVNPRITAVVKVLNNQTDIIKTANIDIAITDIVEILDGTPFVTTWSIPDDDLNIVVPVNPNYEYDYYIDWGDDSNTSNNTGDASHTYSSPGNYTVSIFGEFPAIYFLKDFYQYDEETDSYSLDKNNRNQIVSIDQWGDIEWKSMNSAFYHCVELTYNASDIPNLSGVRDMQQMFSGTVKFNGAIGDWDVSSTIDMISMFSGALKFNQPLNQWDVSSVVNMLGMFLGAESFNQPINNWDVGAVTDMSYMFTNAQSFNQDIGGWNVSKVNSMFKMFENASSFDKNLGGWKLSNIRSAGYLRDMLDNSGLSIDSYEATLKGWSESADTPSGIQLGAENMVYCSNGEIYRNALIEKDWIFNLDRKGTNEDCQ